MADSKDMRTFCVALFGVAALTGCSMTVAGSIPDAKGHVRPYSLHIDSRTPGRDVVAKSLGFSPIFAVTPKAATAGTRATGQLDVGEVARQAMRIPDEIDALRRDLTVFASVTAGTGALGFVLFVTGRRRRLTFVTSPALEPLAAAVAEPAAVSNIEPEASQSEPRRCACEAPIATRSRTGRCRRCARIARGSRPRVLHVEMPSTIVAQVHADHDDDDDSIEPTRAVLALSRIGKQRQYYIVEAAAANGA